MIALPQRSVLTVPLAVGAATLAGALSATQPMAAAALVGLAVLVVLTVLFPVAQLIVLLVLTTLVPFELQNAFSASPGLLVSDALLILALARAILLLLQRPLDRVRIGALTATLLLMGIAVAQAAHGITQGRNVSTTGAELRALLGFGTVIVTLALVDDPLRRRTIVRALTGIGLLLGLLGVAQWILQIPFAGAGDFGVREGVALTSSGRGQIQGGLFAFPVAIILSVAAFAFGALRSPRARAIVLCVLALNAVSLLLTYERTFWLATLLGCGYVAARAGWAQRVRMLIVGAITLFVLAVSLAVVAPETVTTARERLLSIGQYGKDNAVRYRLIEARHVIDQIQERPWAGSGLGATIYWGRPYDGVAPKAYSFVHNGFLWLAWKLGIPGAAILLSLITFAVLRRGRPRGDPLLAAVVAGSQGGLLALMVAGVTFPSFTTASITPVLGVLLAFCFLPHERASKP